MAPKPMRLPSAVDNSAAGIRQQLERNTDARLADAQVRMPDGYYRERSRSRSPTHTQALERGFDGSIDVEAVKWRKQLEFAKKEAALSQEKDFNDYLVKRAAKQKNKELAAGFSKSDVQEVDAGVSLSQSSGWATVDPGGDSSMDQSGVEDDKFSDVAWDLLEKAEAPKPKEKKPKASAAKQVEPEEELPEGTLKPGCKVRLQGLKAAAQFNGRCGSIVEYVKESGRWRVNVDDGGSKDLKGENLQNIDFKPGCEVRLHSLKTEHLNGEFGVIEMFVSDTSRWRIKLSNGLSKDLKGDNLVVEETEATKSKNYIAKCRVNLEKHPESEEERMQREKEHLNADMGDDLGGGRFLVRAKLGAGLFSSVFHCKDLKNPGKEYAVKVTRANTYIQLAMKRDIQLMNQLQKTASEVDKEASRCLLKLAFPEGFEHEGRFAMAVELMNCNLKAAIVKYGQGKGLPLLPTVKSFGRDIFLALRVLKRVNLIHTDIKLEHLLVTKDLDAVKLCDFGCVVRVNDEKTISEYLQTRNYRAPEIILGQQYGTEIDVWSVGVVVFYMATGTSLFSGDTNHKVILEILKTCGMFPKVFTKHSTGKFASKYFDKFGDFIDSCGTKTEMCKFINPSRAISTQLQVKLDKPAKGLQESRHQMLVSALTDLIKGCLAVEPQDRITPDNALGHPFFSKGV